MPVRIHCGVIVLKGVQRFFEKIHEPHLIAFHTTVRQSGDSFAGSYPGTVEQLRSIVAQRGLE